MKITVGGDRDWRKFFTGKLSIVFNGVEVHNCTEADDEAGYIVRFRLDERGRMIADGFRAATERLEGSVVFIGDRRFSPDDAAAAAVAKRARRAARNCRIQNRAEISAGGLS